MTSHARTVAFGLALAVALPAGANPQGTARRDNPAAEAFAEGTRLYRKADYEGALEAFHRSYQLHSHFLTQCNIARCHERNSNMAQAAQHYQRCLKEGGDRSPKAEEIRAALKAVESGVARITIESPGSPPAQAFVDGAPVGTTPLEALVNPGPHKIEVRRPDARPGRATVELQIGERRTVVLRTSPLVSATPVDDGTGAFDPTRPSPAPARRGLSPLWFWSAVGLTGALAVTMTALGAKTLQAHSAYKEDPTEERFNQVIDLRLYTNVFIGLTAAAAGASTFLLFYTDFRRESGDQSERDRAFIVGAQGRF